MRRRVPVAFAAIAVVLLGALTPRAADAAEPRLLRVVLLRVADRVSLALEMTSEPQKASLRILSARALEIETGPISGFLREEELAPAGASFVRQVSIQKYVTGSRAAFVRARVTFDAPGAGNVRVVGRTVYIDLTPSGASRAEMPIATRSARQPALAPHAATPVPPTPHARPSPGKPASESLVGYESAVRPLLDRLTEIGPFLTSAAVTPAPDVLGAVGGSLAAVERPLRSMDVPEASRSGHDVLLAAIAMASRAVAPDFRGDRVAQARRALTLLDAARTQLQ